MLILMMGWKTYSVLVLVQRDNLNKNNAYKLFRCHTQFCSSSIKLNNYRGFSLTGNHRRILFGYWYGYHYWYAENMIETCSLYYSVAYVQRQSRGCYPFHQRNFCTTTNLQSRPFYIPYKVIWIPNYFIMITWYLPIPPPQFFFFKYATGIINHCLVVVGRREVGWRKLGDFVYRQM